MVPVSLMADPFAVHLKLSQHCLLIGYIPIQNKNLKKKELGYLGPLLLLRLALCPLRVSAVSAPTCWPSFLCASFWSRVSDPVLPTFWAG